ncbi:hypothetical protein PTSG_11746 [Salpingoeca rosetta]|uniref:Uncharacterized protein n=1 Tax=Salpingoeca rosetta (strain ATCC 50818 / BSB-021) TaxID=946362 RepID=F2U0H5_SALR5|nr:uncharacterized protein PTSG_11746 [Salpingoeca rosetta]EGD80903.1 hypothetical protein PTSG_11746 [Salpingoeca rosetta]|eukprot:XP_004997464.1 hypothetical protein PTSG_11746 [Salpingoeca rosetta]
MKFRHSTYATAAKCFECRDHHANNQQHTHPSPSQDASRVARVACQPCHSPGSECMRAYNAREDGDGNVVALPAHWHGWRGQRCPSPENQPPVRTRSPRIPLVSTLLTSPPATSLSAHTGTHAVAHAQSALSFSAATHLPCFPCQPKRLVLVVLVVCHRGPAICACMRSNGLRTTRIPSPQ